MGITRDMVIGKSPYDFYPKEIAEHILKHNEKVMNSGEVLSQDESIHNFTTGAVVNAMSIKAPLYDEDGNVIGIIGTSIDITAEKEAERLRLENQIQQAKIEENKKISDLMRNILSLLKGHQIDEVNDKLETLGKDRLPSNKNLSKEISLTKREREILYYLSLDLLPKEIANIIGIVEKNPNYSAITVQTFIEKLYAKFGVNNVGQLLRAAHPLGIVPFNL